MSYMLLWLPMIAAVLWKIFGVLNKINENLSKQNSGNLVKIENNNPKQQVETDKQSLDQDKDATKVCSCGAKNGSSAKRCGDCGIKWLPGQP